ncbi:hypothetical protein [Halorussus aquaticus]|uniref:Uncharacterized protein n=1 Tax=Halorussus aquaticus TaxID=2953748 RepID=A0ABD5Q0V3_9EURY|nr:hypothetical protein [Halorussus aquaticus]
MFSLRFESSGVQRSVRRSSDRFSATPLVGLLRPTEVVGGWLDRNGRRVRISVADWR